MLGVAAGEVTAGAGAGAEVSDIMDERLLGVLFIYRGWARR